MANEKNERSNGSIFFRCLQIVTFLIAVFLLIVYFTNTIEAELIPWKGEWGSFLGSLIGCFVTIIVLRMTLKNNRNILLQEVQFNNFPSIQVRFKNEKAITNKLNLWHEKGSSYKKEYVQKLNYINKDPFTIMLTNIGLGAAFEMYIQYEACSSIDLDSFFNGKYLNEKVFHEGDYSLNIGETVSIDYTFNASSGTPCQKNILYFKDLIGNKYVYKFCLILDDTYLYLYSDSKPTLVAKK